jgi:hypothetical protein
MVLDNIPVLLKVSGGSPNLTEMIWERTSRFLSRSISSYVIR